VVSAAGAKGQVKQLQQQQQRACVHGHRLEAVEAVRLLLWQGVRKLHSLEVSQEITRAGVGQTGIFVCLPHKMLICLHAYAIVWPN